jgi:hypothetical protein
VAVIVFTIGGGICLLTGLAFAILGLYLPSLLLDRLPPGSLLDASAIGGGGVALGVMFSLLAVLHLGLAISLRRDPARAVTRGVVLGSLMALTALSFALALATTAMTEVSVAPLLAIGGAVLFGVTAAYVAATASLLRVRPPEPDRPD